MSSFFQLSRKTIIQGTYHLTFDNIYFNLLRSLVYHNLDVKLVTLEKEWNQSNSYKDYEINFFFTVNDTAPLIPFYTLKLHTTKMILGSI